MECVQPRMPEGRPHLTGGAASGAWMEARPEFHGLLLCMVDGHAPRTRKARARGRAGPWQMGAGLGARTRWRRAGRTGARPNDNLEREGDDEYQSKAKMYRRCCNTSFSPKAPRHNSLHAFHCEKCPR